MLGEPSLISEMGLAVNFELEDDVAVESSWTSLSPFCGNIAEWSATSWSIAVRIAWQIIKEVSDSSMSDILDWDDRQSARYRYTDEVVSVLKLWQELWYIELGLELVTLDLAKSNRLDFLGWSEGARDSIREHRGLEKGGRSGSSCQQR